jgi:hypothetical protein
MIRPNLKGEEMRKSTSVLTLLLALGVCSAGPVMTKFGPFAATTAFAENDDDSSGLIYDDDAGADESGGLASDDDSNEGSEDFDDVGVVGSSPGPIFDEGAASSSACKEPSCKVKAIIK